MFNLQWIFPKILLLFTTFIITAAIYFPARNLDKTPNYDRFSLENPPMCASVDRLEVDFGDMTMPLAPKLQTNWDHSFKVTTNSSEAQHFFDQGLFLTYAFNHAEAERAFKEAIRLDPDCAMAYWGAALSLGPNINRPMREEVNKEAFELSRKATELGKACSPKEQAMIEALATRYQEDPPADRSSLDMAYANEMRVVAHRYREDVDILTLFTESLMDTTPWDYWNNDGTPKLVTREIHATLEYVMEMDPTHPGANHYYIHSMEEYRPEMAEKSADHLTKSQYISGHLVHMPSHIYVRLGRYEDANTANKGGIALDEEYIEVCQAQGYYPALYYPHNVHFLWFGASMNGQRALAMDAARKTAEKGRSVRFQSIPLYSMLRFGMWEELLKEPRPENNHVYMGLLWHYARGMAYAKTGDLKQAKAELAVVTKRNKSKEMKKLDGGFAPYTGLGEICRLLLAGEIAGTENDLEQKVSNLRQAVAIQDGFRYMEPPYYYIQIRQALGAALLEAGQPAEAEAVYRKELEKFPDNGWSLFGLYQSLEAQGKAAAAEEALQQFRKAWQLADVDITASVL